MVKKSAGTSSQTSVNLATEAPDLQLENLDMQTGNDAGISVAGVEVEGPTEADIEKFMDIARQLEHELCSIVVGQERVIRELLLALLAGGHVLLEGVPGLGQTLLVRTRSEEHTSEL